MKSVLSAVLMLMPVAAAAACQHDAGGGCAHGGHLSTALMAGAAALGWWVLRHAEKDAGAVRWAGRVVGWGVLVVGLLGFLCGACSHMCKAMGRTCPLRGGDRVQQMGMSEMPPGHPPMGETRSGRKR